VPADRQRDRPVDRAGILTRPAPPRLIAAGLERRFIGKGFVMLTLYYGPGACSMASHIVLEESGEKYEPRRMDLAKGEQRTDAYLKMNPQGRVPLLQLDNGEPLAENTAILPYLGKRFGLWPKDGMAEAKALSTIGFFAASVHPAHAHVGRPERYTADQSAFPGIKEQGLKTFHGHLKQIDGMYAGREWLGDSYSVPSSSTPGACAASCRWAS
jgi:glutathione S-transferase